MLDFIRGKVTDRKLRLFAVACCRRIHELFPDGPATEVVRIAEQFADGNVTDDDRCRAYATAQHEWADILDHCAFFYYPTWMACVATAFDPWIDLGHVTAARAAERTSQ